MDKDNNSMRIPDFLRKGDKIGMVAPARKVEEAAIAQAIKTFEDWGLEVVLGDNLFGEYHQFSGSDKERAKDLQSFLDDSSVKAIIAARGGYGTLRIIDQLDFTSFVQKPKWIIGYSDITVLHNHIQSNCNLATLHATMPVNFSQDADSVESLRKALFGEPLIYQWENDLFNGRSGSAEGLLCGGNLSLLYALNNSVSDINTDGKILFLEDLDEYLYHIDRMLLSLKRSGKLSSISGLLIGGFTQMKDNAIPYGKTAEAIIKEIVSDKKFPLAFNFPAGHTLKNLALVFGRRAKLMVSEQCRLEFL